MDIYSKLSCSKFVDIAHRTDRMEIFFIRDQNFHLLILPSIVHVSILNFNMCYSVLATCLHAQIPILGPKHKVVEDQSKQMKVCRISILVWVKSNKGFKFWGTQQFIWLGGNRANRKSFNKKSLQFTTGKLEIWSFQRFLEVDANS